MRQSIFPDAVDRSETFICYVFVCVCVGVCCCHWFHRLFLFNEYSIHYIYMAHLFPPHIPFYIFSFCSLFFSQKWIPLCLLSPDMCVYYPHRPSSSMLNTSLKNNDENYSLRNGYYFFLLFPCWLAHKMRHLFPYHGYCLVTQVWQNGIFRLTQNFDRKLKWLNPNLSYAVKNAPVFIHKAIYFPNHSMLSVKTPSLSFPSRLTNSNHIFSYHNSWFVPFSNSFQLQLSRLKHCTHSLMYTIRLHFQLNVACCLLQADMHLFLSCQWACCFSSLYDIIWSIEKTINIITTICEKTVCQCVTCMVVHVIWTFHMISFSYFAWNLYWEWWLWMKIKWRTEFERKRTMKRHTVTLFQLNNKNKMNYKQHRHGTRVSIAWIRFFTLSVIRKQKQ